jgi:hypothetical protein
MKEGGSDCLGWAVKGKSFKTVRFELYLEE